MTDEQTQFEAKVQAIAQDELARMKSREFYDSIKARIAKKEKFVWKTPVTTLEENIDGVDWSPYDKDLFNNKN